MSSQEWEAKLGDKQYKQLLRQFKSQILPPDHRATVTVKRVGKRLADAATLFRKNYVDSKNLLPHRDNIYTFTVLKNDTANAFVLPGNHVFVFTGLFKYTRGEDELAAVLAHELGHTLARHSGEKISGSMLVTMLARFSLLVDPSGTLYSLFLPTATLLHDLPNSREAEVEADQIGIYLAGEACYDPKAARNVFVSMKNEEMTSHGNSKGPPQFLSTHPSHDTRISNFSNPHFMKDSLERFNAHDGNRCRPVRNEMKRAREYAALAAQKRERWQRKARNA